MIWKKLKGQQEKGPLVSLFCETKNEINEVIQTKHASQKFLKIKNGFRMVAVFRSTVWITWQFISDHMKNWATPN